MNAQLLPLCLLFATAVAGLPAQERQGAADDQGGYQVAPNQNAIQRMPELRNAPAPAWVKPGMRLTWLIREASIPKSRFTADVGPDGWSKLENSVSASGQGLEEVDVLAVPADCVVINYLGRLVNPEGTTHVTSVVGGPTSGGDAVDAWIHPDVLHRYMDLNGPGMSSFRTRYQAAGRSFDVVWRQVRSAGAMSADVYDIASGLRVHSVQCTESAQINLDIGVSANGTMSLSHRTLVGMRMVTTPWTKGRLPRALRELRQLVYEGSNDTCIPNTPVMRGPEQVVLTRVGLGADFVVLRRTGSMVAGNVRSELPARDLACGPMSLTPWAVEPADLARLRQGQELDCDPVTKLVTGVSYVGRDARGRSVVVISTGVPGRPDQQQHDASYDATSGLCVGVRSTLPSLHQVETLALVRAE